MWPAFSGRTNPLRSVPPPERSVIFFASHEKTRHRANRAAYRQVARYAAKQRSAAACSGRPPGVNTGAFARFLTAGRQLALSTIPLPSESIERDRFARLYSKYVRPAVGPCARPRRCTVRTRTGPVQRSRTRRASVSETNRSTWRSDWPAVLLVSGAAPLAPAQGENEVSMPYSLYELNKSLWAPALPWLQAAADFFQIPDGRPFAQPARRFAAG
jgi:hypothetical protein